MIAALYIQDRGAYSGLADVDPWPESRDARTYPGPWPVVAHPPCQRWGRFWSGGPSAKTRTLKGDDDGCFKAALAAARLWGGVIEHPEASHAWHAFALRTPPRAGGWITADPFGGWTCCVEQGHYGHAARKATWLYLIGHKPPPLQWGPSQATLRLDAGFHTAAERKAATRQGAVGRLSKRQRSATPAPFRDLLIALAHACKPRGSA